MSMSNMPLRNLAVWLAFAMILLPAALVDPAQASPAPPNKLTAERSIVKRRTVQAPLPKPLPKRRAVPRAKPRPAAPPLAKLVYNPRGRQVFFRPRAAQMANACAIVRVARKRHLPYRAMVIAIGTSLQESHLNNYGHLGDRNDHDSLGLFQQRPSTGWGTPSQVTTPGYAATVFYNALLRVSNWHGLPLTAAAQRVQRSAFPLAYAKWEVMAGRVVQGCYGAGPYAGVAK